MRKLLACWLLLVLGLTANAQGDFAKTLRPEDYAGAGLQKLTPEELARLEDLVQRYKSGELAHLQQQAETKVREMQQAAEQQAVVAAQKVAAAEAKAKAAEAARTAAAPEGEGAGKKQPGWFRALVTLNKASDKPAKAEPLVGRLVGEFHGWTGGTIFRLEDGTRWQQQNRNDRYDFSPALHAPVVHIKPASLLGFWLEIEGVNMRVRVVPIELPEQK